MLVVHDAEIGSTKAKRPVVDEDGMIKSGIVPAFKGIKKRFRKKFPDKDAICEAESELLRTKGTFVEDNVDIEVVEVVAGEERVIKPEAVVGQTQETTSKKRKREEEAQTLKLAEEAEAMMEGLMEMEETTGPVKEEAVLEPQVKRSKIGSPGLVSSPQLGTNEFQSPLFSHSTFQTLPSNPFPNAQEHVSPDMANNTISSPSVPTSSPVLLEHSPTSLKLPTTFSTQHQLSVPSPLSQATTLYPPVNVNMSQNLGGMEEQQNRVIEETRVGQVGGDTLDPSPSLHTNPLYLQLTSQQSLLNSEIKDLEDKIEKSKAKSMNITNPMMRNRLIKVYQQYEAQLLEKQQVLQGVEDQISVFK